MDSTVNERIKEIIEHEKLSVRAFALKIGVSQPIIFNNVSKGRDPSYDTLLKIVRTFPHINSEWLLTGEGFMLKPADSNSETEEIKAMFEAMKERVDKLEREAEIKKERKNKNLQ